MKAVLSLGELVCRYAAAADVLADELLLSSSSVVDAIFITTPTMKLRMPERWSIGNVFQRVVMRLFMICRAIYCALGELRKRKARAGCAVKTQCQSRTDISRTQAQSVTDVADSPSLADWSKFQG